MAKRSGPGGEIGTGELVTSGVGDGVGNFGSGEGVVEFPDWVTYHDAAHGGVVCGRAVWLRDESQSVESPCGRLFSRDG